MKTNSNTQLQTLINQITELPRPQVEHITIKSTTGEETLDGIVMEYDEEEYSDVVLIPVDLAKDKLKEALERLSKILQGSLGDDDYYDCIPDFMSQILALSHILNIYEPVYSYIKTITENYDAEHGEGDDPGSTLVPENDLEYYKSLIED